MTGRNSGPRARARADAAPLASMAESPRAVPREGSVHGGGGQDQRAVHERGRCARGVLRSLPVPSSARNCASLKDRASSADTSRVDGPASVPRRPAQASRRRRAHRAHSRTHRQMPRDWTLLLDPNLKGRLDARGDLRSSRRPSSAGATPGRRSPNCSRVARRTP